MNNHISSQFIEILTLSKKKSEKCIKTFKEFLNVCQFVNIPAKCMIEVDKVLLETDECILLYQKCMDQSQEHLQKCKDDECKRTLEKLMYVSKEGIKSLSNIEIECNHDLKPCIDAVSLSIIKCNSFIEFCNKILEDVTFN